MEWIELQSFASSAIIHLMSRQPTTTSSSISTTFLQGKHFQKVAGNVFQEFIESWSMDFYATEINIFLTGKNVLILMVPILINKDVFKPSYNDLKIMVWNHNYFCINLINPLYFNRKKKINIVQKIVIINRIRSSATGPTEIWWIFYIHITSWSK